VPNVPVEVWQSNEKFLAVIDTEGSVTLFLPESKMSVLTLEPALIVWFSVELDAAKAAAGNAAKAATARTACTNRNFFIFI
jgi:hypothetical protein